MVNMPTRPPGAADPAISVYEHGDFKGWELSFTGVQVSNVGSDANDKISSVKITSGKWELFVDADFKGKSIVLGKGAINSLSPLGFNDKVSSLRPVDW